MPQMTLRQSPDITFRMSREFPYPPPPSPFPRNAPYIPEWQHAGNSYAAPLSHFTVVYIHVWLKSKYKFVCNYYKKVISCTFLCCEHLSQTADLSLRSQQLMKEKCETLPTTHQRKTILFHVSVRPRRDSTTCYEGSNEYLKPAKVFDAQPLKCWIFFLIYTRWDITWL